MNKYILVWLLWMVSVLVGIDILSRQAQEQRKLRAVWYDHAQRLQRLEDHLEQLEYYLAEDEYNAELEQLPIEEVTK